MKAYLALAGAWSIFAAFVLTVLAVAIYLGDAPLSWSDNVSPVELTVFAALLFVAGGACMAGSQT